MSQWGGFAAETIGNCLRTIEAT